MQNGITGRVDLQPVEGAEAADELPPLHEAAFDAIERGDLDAAVTAYEQALADNPEVTDAERLGLAQVRLMQRTRGVDLVAARAAAAADPTDVAAAITVATSTCSAATSRTPSRGSSTSSGPRRRARRARAHLLDLFNVVGNHDERVPGSTAALMSASLLTWCRPAPRRPRRRVRPGRWASPASCSRPRRAGGREFRRDRHGWVLDVRALPSAHRVPLRGGAR